MQTATQQSRARRERADYRRRNFFRTRLPEAVRDVRLAIAEHVCRAPMFQTELRAKIHRADGTIVDLGVLSRKIVTTAGVNFLASTLINTAEPEVLNQHDAGTGATAAAIGDTALQTPAGITRVAGTQSNPSSNIYRSVATLPFVSTLAITEWGLFSASTSGTLFDHFVFSAINVVSGDSITFTFNLTLTAGG